MRNLLTPRTNLLPVEYPEVLPYKDAIRQSYWLHTEYNWTEDVQDYRVKLTPHQQEVLRRGIISISQVEVKVKRFWSLLGRDIPKPEFEAVGATFAESECYDDQTEILTNTGWKLFDSLTSRDLVAQYDPATHHVTFTKPTHGVKDWHEGVLHQYIGGRTNLMVTPNHRLAVIHPQKTEVEERLSGELKLARNYRYPTSGWATGSRTYLTDLERVLIAIQADGSAFGTTPSGTGRRDITFNLKRPDKVARLDTLLENAGITPLRREVNGYVKYNFHLPDEAPHVDTLKTFGWVDLSSLSAGWGQQFIQELGHWDSHVTDTSVTYYNAREEAVDKVQAVAALSGYTTNKGVNRTAEQSMETLNPDGVPRKTSQTVYALTIRVKDRDDGLPGVVEYPAWEEVPYSGYVYCVTVPTGFLVTRRGGRVAVSGNSRHADGYSHLLPLLDLEDEFNNIPNIPALQGRMGYLDRWMGASPTGNLRAYIMKMVLFSIFVEYVSLFSQFYVLKSFHKHRNLFKGLSNLVDATSKEEELHGKFGFLIVNLFRQEYPEVFDEELDDVLSAAVMKAIRAETKVLDWIFESGDLDFVSKDDALDFISHRISTALNECGFGHIVGERGLTIKNPEAFEWFEVELLSTKHYDFFNQRPTNYNMMNKSFSVEDVFGD